MRGNLSKTQVKFKCSHFETKALAYSFRIQPLREVSFVKALLSIDLGIDGQEKERTKLIMEYRKGLISLQKRQYTKYGAGKFSISLIGQIKILDANICSK